MCAAHKLYIVSCFNNAHNARCSTTLQPTEPHWSSDCASQIASLLTSPLICVYTLCPEKKETKMFSVISPTKLGQFWWNLTHSFLNKFAATWYKRFPPHLNNVSTLPCETWNAHYAHATIALLEKLQNLSHLMRWSPNLPDLNPVDNSVWKILQDVQNMHHWSGWTETVTENGVEQAGSCRYCGSHPSAA